MLIEVGSLSKREMATLFATLKWPLTCVNAQMIEKIVPFLETFVALSMSAKQLLHNSFGFRVFQLEDQVVSCFRNFTVLDLFCQLSRRIEGVAWGHLDFEVCTLEIGKQTISLLDLS